MFGSNKRLLSNTTIVYIAVGVLLMTIMTIIGTSVFLRIMDIEVEGASMYNVEEIVECSGISTGENLIFVNTRNASRNILNALPFINDVRISRVLPDKLFIEVSESIAIATVDYAGETLVIDSTGRVLMQTDAKPDGLIEVRGVALDDVIEGNQRVYQLNQRRY